MRFSCDTQCYRQQRFKPFGLVSVYTEAFFNVQRYRQQRFKPCGLISAHLRVLIFTSSRGSNPLACGRDLLVIVSLDWHRFKPCGSMISFGSLSV